MALSDLLAQNVFVRWAFGDRHRHDLALSMASLKLGERLLQVGCSDAGLVAALAAKVGYTGRAAAIDTDATRAARMAEEVERRGVLAEIQYAPAGEVPFEAEAFDVVVFDLRALRPEEVPPEVDAARRVLRAGGRCLAIGRGSGGAAGAADAFAQVLREHRFSGARVLAARDGLWFVEALRARSDVSRDA
jgi:ubiquinone/menaquinone biosynthesis C-methylase UbiE